MCLGILLTYSENLTAFCDFIDIAILICVPEFCGTHYEMRVKGKTDLLSLDSRSPNMPPVAGRFLSVFKVSSPNMVSLPGM